MKAVSMAAPFQWILQAGESFRRNPRPLFGGFALVCLVGLVPSVAQVALNLIMPGNAVAVGIVVVLSLVFGLLLMPPLLGGVLRLLHAGENGLAIRPGDVFAAYADSPFALRMIAQGLLTLALNIGAVFALFVVMPGKELFAEIARRAVATAPGSRMDTAGLPPFPPSFLLWLLVAMFVLMLLTNVGMFACTRAALSGRAAVAAVGDGFVAAFRNFLPLLGFAIAGLCVGMVVMMVFALFAGVLVMIASAISPALGALVSLPVDLAMLMGVYVVMFGFYYHAWREVFSGDGATEATAGIDTIAL
jgi:hypothetical protein